MCSSGFKPCHSHEQGTYLGTSRRVLRSTTSDEFCVSLDEIIVDCHMLLFRKDGIVRFQAVFVEQRLVTASISIVYVILWKQIYPCAWMSSSGFSRKRRSNW